MQIKYCIAVLGQPTINKVLYNKISNQKLSKYMLYHNYIFTQIISIVLCSKRLLIKLQ